MPAALCLRSHKIVYHIFGGLSLLITYKKKIEAFFNLVNQNFIHVSFNIIDFYHDLCFKISQYSHKWFSASVEKFYQLLCLQEKRREKNFFALSCCAVTNQIKKKCSSIHERSAGTFYQRKKKNRILDFVRSNSIRISGVNNHMVFIELFRPITRLKIGSQKYFPYLPFI